MAAPSFSRSRRLIGFWSMAGLPNDWASPGFPPSRIAEAMAGVSPLKGEAGSTIQFTNDRSRSVLPDLLFSRP